MAATLNATGVPELGVQASGIYNATKALVINTTAAMATFQAGESVGDGMGWVDGSGWLLSAGQCHAQVCLSTPSIAPPGPCAEAVAWP